MAAIYLPNLVQRIVLDPSGLKAGAAASKTAMAPVQKAMTAGSASAMAMGSSLNTLGFRAQTTGRMMLKLAAPIALIGGLAIKSFSAFEASMTKIEALVGVSAGAVRGFTKDVKALAGETGRAPQELADAMFFITSAGLRGATATGVLAASAKAAAVGLGNTAVVADAATSAVNAYGSENLSGAMAVDTLTAAVREGKVEATQLAPAIGKAIPVASAMGIEFHEVAAAIAAMTRTGTDARTSAIQLRQIMQSLLDPSRQTVNALREMGVAEGELRDMARSQGLLAVLVKLRDLASENADAFADVFPNIRALAGALDITGPNLKENQQIFASLANSAGDTEKAFRVTSDTAKFKLAKGMSSVKVSFLELGEAMLPVVDLIQALMEKFAGMIKWIASNGALVGFIASLAALAAIGGTILVLFGAIATTLAFKSQAVEYLTQKVVTNTAATGANTTYQIANGVAITASGTAATATAASMTKMNLAMKAAPWALAIGAILFLGLQMGLFGKKTRSTTQNMEDLVAALKDVRTMGDRVLTNVGGLGSPIAGYSEADKGEVYGIAADFKRAFDEDLQKAFDEGGPISGGLAVEAALLKAFKDAGDSDTVRQAMSLLMATYNRQIGGDMNVFERLFPKGMEDEAFGNFLEGVAAGAAGIGEALRIDAQLAADRASGAVLNLREARADLDEYQDAARGGDASSQDKHRKAAITMSDALDTVANDLSDFLQKGMAEDFIVEYTALMDAFGKQEGSTPEGLQEIQDLLFKAMPLLADYADETENLPDILDLIAGDPKQAQDRLGSAFASMQNLANAYRIALRDIHAEMAYGLIEPMSNAEAETKAVDLAIERLTRDTKTLASDGFHSVADAILRMDTAFAKADKAAKRFNKQFDDFIGRTMDLDDANTGFMAGQQDLADAILESGGAMDMYSEKGRDAREAMKDQIRGAQEMAAAMFENGFSAEEAEGRFTSFVGAIEQTALANGAAAEDIARLFDEIGLDPEDLRLAFISEESAAETEASSELQNSVGRMVDKIIPFVQTKGGEISDGLLGGVTKGLYNGKPELDAATKSIFTGMVDEALFVLGIKSPSKVFAVSVGQPITAGIAKGILDGKKNLKNVIREVVDDAIDVAQTAVSAASRSITAILDFGDAERALDRLKQKAGGKGVDTRFELLNQKKLERAVEEAKRNLRLGKGNQEDLELAVMEAEYNLEDFQTAADTGDEVVRAELDLASAGLEVADAEAQMRMEGEKAIETFKSLGDAVGLTSDEVNDLLDIRGDGTSLVERIFDKDTLDAIAAVGRGEGWVRVGGGGGGRSGDTVDPEGADGAAGGIKTMVGPLAGMTMEEITAAVNPWATAPLNIPTASVRNESAMIDSVESARNIVTNHVTINTLPADAASTVVKSIEAATFDWENYGGSGGDTAKSTGASATQRPHGRG